MSILKREFFEIFRIRSYFAKFDINDSANTTLIEVENRRFTISIEPYNSAINSCFDFAVQNQNIERCENPFKNYLPFCQEAKANSRVAEYLKKFSELTTQEVAFLSVYRTLLC